MRAVVYRTDDPTLRLVDRTPPVPGAGEVLVRVAVSGVNATDWKARRAAYPGTPEGVDLVPNQDGAGTIEAVGPGVTRRTVGERVWLWEAAWRRADGTAQELVAIPAAQAVPLPEGASLDLGASIGIPAVTAHRCLTVREGAPARLSAGALAGQTVLVAGGAGAVGHAAVGLARWAGARVVATVSSPEKAALATSAGAQHVVNYRDDGAADAVRDFAPDGVDVVVEVAPAANAALDTAVLGLGGVVAAYAAAPGDDVTVPVRDMMTRNIRWQFVLVYTMPRQVKLDAVAAVTEAAAAGALRVGADAGLPLHYFTLEQMAEAHDAVADGAVGKVLVRVAT